METMLLTKLAPVVVQDGGALVPRTVDFPPHGGSSQSKLSVVEWRRVSPAERADR
jgi:hypothetical protein